MPAGLVERLHRSDDITSVLRSGRRRGGALVVVHLRPASGGASRVAVVASRRVGGAVQRNRAKRLLREASRQLCLPQGYDMVLVARPAAAAARCEAVRAELERLLGQLGAA